MEGGLSFLLLFVGISAFLREIGYLVSERQSRNIEHMQIMGVKKFTYFFASLLSSMTVQLVVLVVYVVVIKLFIIKHTNFFLLYVHAAIFIWTMLLWAYLIAAFFTSTKNSIIFGIIFWITFQIPYAMRDKIKQYGDNSLLYSTISPMAGMGQLVYAFLLAESSEKAFTWRMLLDNIAQFKGVNYFIILTIQQFVLMLLGLYVFYVFPHEIGVASHPLFFLGFPRIWKKKQHFKPELQRKLSDNFEKNDSQFDGQVEKNQTLSIRKLNKIYPNKTYAVKNLDLDFYESQIFSLLGHNGAGKTTTIQMICGMIDKTRGEISVLGLNHQQNQKQIKKLMGVCT